MTGPSPLLLTFYGDDFTGSTDAMEALALAGLRTVLFFSPPAPELLEDRFPDLRCMGVAGTSRAMSPAEMDRELEPVLRELWRVGAPLFHYKVCSTFDSSPEIGSIGHVVDIARGHFTGSDPISVLAGAPPLRRYTVFGHHFAAAGDQIYRLDRHPTMAAHPVTPMDEADLRVHLARQTGASIALMSVIDLEGDPAQVEARYGERTGDRPALVLYDVLNDDHLEAAGRLIWQQGQRARHFVVGSSGVAYALTAHWRACGMIGVERAALARVEPVRPLLVVSGSASPITAEQIAWAAQHGFDCLRAPVEELVQPRTAEDARRDTVTRALQSLSAGTSVVIYAASGPADPSIRATRQLMVTASGVNSGNTARVLGAALGRIARELIALSGIGRVVIAGGDTSSYATQELGLYGLEMLGELAGGAPLCRAHSDDRRFDGLEIALKGGQMGGPDYFGRARG
jgi:uncharacterized protein YgbK (DUF1537 family)